MGSHSDGGWAYFPEELLLKIFSMASDGDKRLLHPLTQVCSQWNKIIKINLITDYQSFLQNVKINLKFKQIVNKNVIVNNLFTCFYLAEYDEDFLFWPKQAADNMVYCSGVQGNFQIISYQITSSYIDYVKLTDANYIEKPSDCYKISYQEYNDVSPFSGSKTSQVELIRRNTYPVFKKSIYTVCLYHIDPNTPSNDTLTFVSNPIRYHFNTNRKLNYATISLNNKYLVLAFSGLIQVYALPDLKNDTSISLNNLEPCFSRQQPSVVKYLSIDDKAHVLFLKSLRLGGLSIINLITGEELEFPHYRLDLNMSSQINDHIVLLNGYQETIVYGLPQRGKTRSATSSVELSKGSSEASSSGTDDDYLNKIKKLRIIPNEVPIWNYFENHINANLEDVIPVNNILPTDAPGCFIGLIKGYSFNGKLESIFSGGTNDRSIDLVLLISRSYPLDLKNLKGKYLEDFTEESLHDDDNEDDDNDDTLDEESILTNENLESIADENESFNIEADSSSDDFYSLRSQFIVVPLIFNVQFLSRSSLLSISNDGKRFAILINNLLFAMNVSSESILLILKKFLDGTFETLDLLKVFKVYTDRTDFRLQLATTSAKLNSHTSFKKSNIYMIDELLELPEFKEQHKVFNNNNSAIESDDDDDELLSDELATTDVESLLDGEDARTRGRNLQAEIGLWSPNVEYKPQLVWQGNDKIVISFNGNLHVLLSLEDIFDF